MSKGRLITFEGLECSGKGIQSERLLDHFNSNKPGQAILVREPGGTTYGEALRALIKHPRKAIGTLADNFIGHEDFPGKFDLSSGFERSPYCELFMFAASRAEFVAKIIKPALESGLIIICDRFYDSTRAYQGGGRFHSGEKMITAINQINHIATQGLVPDLTLFLDIPIIEMIERSQGVSEKDAHFEKTCDRDFFERVRKEYLQISVDEPERFKVIDGDQPFDQVWYNILTEVNL